MLLHSEIAYTFSAVITLLITLFLFNTSREWLLARLVLAFGTAARDSTLENLPYAELIIQFNLKKKSLGRLGKKEWQMFEIEFYQE